MAGWLGIPCDWACAYVGVVVQIAEAFSWGCFLMMATAIVLPSGDDGCGARGRAVAVGTARATEMVLNIVLMHPIGMLGTQLFLGCESARPDWGFTRSCQG